MEIENQSNSFKWEPFMNQNQLEKFLKQEIQSVREEFEIKLKMEIKTLREGNLFKKDQTKSKLNEIKETFILWCERSDVNGISKIFDYENSYIRFFLLVIFLVSLGVTAWILSWSIFLYLEYGVVSKIGVVYEQPTEFPAVTICDNDLFTTQNV